MATVSVLLNRECHGVRCCSGFRRRFEQGDCAEGEGETETKQIGDGVLNSTEPFEPSKGNSWTGFSGY